MLRQFCRPLLQRAALELRSTAHTARSWSAAAIQAETEVERHIADKIQQGIPDIQSVAVKDTSGGCGSMYSIDVVAGGFSGKSIVKQHQMVTKLIQDDIKQWHGFQLTTKAEPKQT